MPVMSAVPISESISWAAALSTRISELWRSLADTLSRRASSDTEAYTGRSSSTFWTGKVGSPVAARHRGR